MSTSGRDWHLDAERLQEAMDRWHARDPDPLESSLLAEFLMDLTVDPFGSGEEDGETGVWNGRVAPFILVICTIDREKNSVHVAGIDYG